MKTEQRLLTATIDHFAETDPTRVIFSVPTGPSTTDYVDISYKRFANSIDRLSWWLKQSIGLSDNLDTICYLGLSDIVYFIFSLAACKCGYKALFTSPRNSIEAHKNLFKRTDCRIIFGPQTPTVSAIVTQCDVDHKAIEPLAHWLDETPVENFKHEKSFDDLVDEPFIVLHSSGTTGLPKPINIPHGVVSIVDNYQNLPSVDGKEIWIKQLKEKRVFCCLPPFHGAAFNFVFLCISFGGIIVLPPASQPPDANMIEMAIDNDLAQAGCMAPSILEEIADSSFLEKLHAWDFVAFGGSPLSKVAGDKLWEVTKVFNLLGATETFNLPELEPKVKDDWQYHAFHPSLGLEFEERSAERFEAVFKLTEQSKMFQGCFQTFKGEETYQTGDLYSKHPSKQGLWLYRGRVDDTIVLSNGEKFNPQDLESTVGAHPDVRAALTVGNGRTQPALLIEPEKSLTDLESESEQIERIWSTVVKANEISPNHAQIDKEHITVLASDNGMPRSSKGAVQRKPAIVQNEDVIDDLYNSAESKVSPSIDLNFESTGALEHSLLEGIQANSKSLGKIDSGSNLFESGMDSLQAVQLTRMLRSDLKSIHGFPDQFPEPSLLYKCPTVESLARTLMSVANGESLPPSPAQEQDDAVTEMQAARKQYSFKQERYQRSTEDSDGKTVILTGSTGRLGSYLLHSLLSDKDVRKIYCLGRSSTDKLRERQLKSQQRKGLSCELERVSFHQFDVGQERWGLDKNLVDQMTKSTTHIIHNAWPVNFNHSFDSFKVQLQGCQTLMRLASECSRLKNLFFVSSVGAANNYSRDKGGDIPEEAISDMLAAESMGYAQSKLVAELLFTDAAQSIGLPTTICRVGQIAGAAKQDGGSWNRDEWFPSLMITSREICQIPKDLGAMDDIDWLPSDLLADTLVQMTFSDTEPSTAKVLHAVNPRRIQWSTLLDDLQQSNVLKDIKTVEFADCIKAIRDISYDNKVSMDKVPAVKLLGFYETLIKGDDRPVFSTTKSTACSEALRNMSHIQAEWLERWTREWFEA